MCGIVGILGAGPVAPQLVDALKRLDGPRVGVGAPALRYTDRLERAPASFVAPQEFLRESCCERILASLSSVSPPATAASSSAIKAFDTPTSAECTTTGRTPSASRSRISPAMIAQFSAVETLRPPNFSTR